MSGTGGGVLRRDLGRGLVVSGRCVIVDGAHARFAARFAARLGCGRRGERRPQHEQRAADVHSHVGHVEDREPLEVDEVDHRAVQPAIAAEQAIAQVADRSTDDEASSDRDHLAGVAAEADDNHHDHDDRDEPDDRADAAPLGERHAAVEREVPLQRPEDMARRHAGERVHRPVLAELIEQHDRESDRSGEPQPW